MKTYGLKFSSGDPRIYTGLTPTFLIFSNSLTGSTAAPPGITEMVIGSGIYNFTYGPTTPIQFLVDGAGSLSSIDRYITGILDPIQAVDEKVGTTSDSFGSTLADPSTVLGHLKRIQEVNEGNKVFTKATGVWDNYSRGSSTLLFEKTLTNTTTAAGST